MELHNKPTKCSSIDGQVIYECPLRSKQLNGVLKLGDKKLSDHPLLANSISHLLELGILSPHYPHLTAQTLYKVIDEGKFEEMISYKITPFGSEVLNRITNRVFLEGLNKASKLTKD